MKTLTRLANYSDQILLNLNSIQLITRTTRFDNY